MWKLSRGLRTFSFLSRYWNSFFLGFRLWEFQVRMKSDLGIFVISKGTELFDQYEKFLNEGVDEFDFDGDFFEDGEDFGQV